MSKGRTGIHSRRKKENRKIDRKKENVLEGGATVLTCRLGTSIDFCLLLSFSKFYF